MALRRGKSNFLFSQVPSVVRPRSVFDRSRTYKTTFNAGQLIPFYWDEILPGDTLSLSVTSFARLATLICPFMDNLWMDFHFFFVPNRLVWDNWQKFCGEQDNPDDSTDYLVPQVTVTPSVGSLYDYFGLPVGKELTVNNLLPRAYHLIFNEFYRDENLIDSFPVDTDDGPDDPNDYRGVLLRGKRKSDPFTSALPWPQKGPGVELPIGDSAPIVGSFTVGGDNWSWSPHTAGTHPSVGSYSPNFGVGSSSTSFTFKDTSSSPNRTFDIIGTGEFDSNAYADLSHATAVTINSLREAFQIQKWYEQLARGGSRYVELVLSMFGCHTGDARLQRPEYLGGGSAPIQVHAVAQTSASGTDSQETYSVDTPQANLAAFGVCGQSGIGFTKSFVEHGHVIGLVSVRGDYTYQQGIDRMWSRQTKFDFYWPAFAHLGEVPILNKELYYSGDSSVDDKAFGYQERWYEYRYGISKITGKLRSGISGSLDCWHLAQYFSNLPTLNSTFINEDPPIDRVIAVVDEPQFIFDSVIKCKMARVMPVYSVPGLVDHF